MFKRIFLVVMDSVGVGEAKDAEKFGDMGASTLGHILDHNGYHLPIFERLGLLDIIGKDDGFNLGYHGKIEPANKAKDTLNGHYEMMGVILDKPFKTYPEGFPIILISELQRITGREIIGNCVASGTEIIEELGEMHMKTGALIIYTSADSVLQVAAHENIIPVEELYKICEQISEIVFNEDYNIGRVIARPFIGKPGDFTRTSRRHDFAKVPPLNFMDLIYNKGLDVIALGKIKDIFANKSITTGIKTTNNMDGIIKLNDFIRSDFNGLCFLNLNDFDSLYGHRRNKDGYLKCIEELDHYLPMIINNLKDDDLIIFTADHGNDPTFKGTDHTRENVPIIFYSKTFKYYGKLPTRTTFADIGATIVDNFKIENELHIGKSYMDILKWKRDNKPSLFTLK